MVEVSIRQYSLMFLTCLEGYPVKLQGRLIADVRSDIELHGLEYAIKKWDKFVRWRYR